MADNGTDPRLSVISEIKDKKIRDLLQGRLAAAVAAAPDAAGAVDTSDDVLNTAHAVLDSERKSRFWWWFLVAITVALVVAILFIIRKAGSGDLGGVGIGRPVIMLAMIVATVGFGGFLIVRAMFTEDANADLEKRFQMGREIFLVFAGIFATVVGFYFGSTDRTQTGSQVGVTALLANGGITALVAGGTPPYKLALVGGQTNLPLTPDAKDGARFTLAVNDKDCPEGLNFVVSGADGAIYPPQPIKFGKDELLAAGWKGCAVEPPVNPKTDGTEGGSTGAPTNRPVASGSPTGTPSPAAT